MSTVTLLELFLGFLAAGVTLWAFGLAAPAAIRPLAAPGPGQAPGGIRPPLAASALAWANRYVSRDGALVGAGLLLLRLAIGGMMIHHGQEKLADPATFAANYVVPLHLPFPLFFAHVAGLSEVLGSWCLILGFLTPVGALALIGTMSVAAYHHILFSGLNIYVLELVVLYLGGSLALLFCGPGRLSLDALLLSDWFRVSAAEQGGRSEGQGALGSGGA